MNEIRVELPIPPASLSPNGRAHWAVKARDAKRYRELAGWKILIEMGKVGHRTWAGPVRVHIVWRTPNKAHTVDVDNVTARCKALLDGATDAGLWLDDDQISGITVERVVGPRGLTVTFTREEQP